MSLDIAAMNAPTDSESPDAPYNPDVFELRVRVDQLIAELQRLRKDYRTLWGMTLGHDGQPLEPGTADDIERLRARLTDLNGENQ